jgi:hypothetical protein
MCIAARALFHPGARGIDGSGEKSFEPAGLATAIRRPLAPRRSYTFGP